jgi:glutaredoxin 3
MLKRLLAQKGVTYEEIDVARDAEKRKWLVSVTGQYTVPQLMIDGKPYGGYTDAVELDRKGELDRRLTAA